MTGLLCFVYTVAFTLDFVVKIITIICLLFWLVERIMLKSIPGICFWKKTLILTYFSAGFADFDRHFNWFYQFSPFEFAFSLMSHCLLFIFIAFLLIFHFLVLFFLITFCVWMRLFAIQNMFCFFHVFFLLLTQARVAK